MVSEAQRKRKRLRRKAARRRDAIRKSAARGVVEHAVETVLARVARRESNSYPMNWCFTYEKYCYVCESPTPEPRAVRAEKEVYNFGWLCCAACLPWVLDRFRPLYSLEIGSVCLDSLVELPWTVLFTRRSRTTRLPTHVRRGTIRGIYMQKSENSLVGRMTEDRVVVSVSWEDDHTPLEKKKHVLLANVIRSDPDFPSSPGEFFALLAKGRTFITERFFACVLREYLLVAAWRKLEARLNSDVMSVCGWYTDD